MPEFEDLVRARLGDRAGQVASEVIEEIGAHIADAHQGALRRGATAAEAHDVVEAELTQVHGIADAIERRRRNRQVVTLTKRGHPFAGLLRDLRHGIRLLTTRRGYAVVVVLTLAVGIGACTAVFSLFQALLLGRLPYPEPDRLVLAWETDTSDPSRRSIVAAPNYLDWQQHTRSFKGFGIWEYLTFNLAGTTDPEQVQGLRASSSLFDVLSVEPAIGRRFTPAEDGPGHLVAVISDAVWRTHFAADRAVIGRPIRLNGVVHEVIGVMPPGFEFPRKGTGVWIPIAFSERDLQRGWHSFLVAARLADGVSDVQARDDIERLGKELADKHPDNYGEGATIQRMDEFGLMNTRRILVALSGAVGLVLLIACVNVASLQLALGVSRRREFVTRLSLGAAYVHLARQVLVEALTVAALGCAGGLAIAWVTTRAADLILSSGFRTLPFRGEVAVTINPEALQFAVAVSIACALLFAFAPLLGLRRRSLQPELRSGDRGSTRLAAGTRRALVTIEIALAIVVLAGAGVMIRSLSAILNVDPGLDPSRVLVMQVSLPQSDTYGPPERDSFCRDLARELSGVPGIVHASAISHLPLGGSNAGRAVTIEGRAEPSPNDLASGNYRLACPDYFATLGIRVTAGREFSDADTRDGQQVTIVNRAFAEQYWPRGDALGQRFKIGGFQSTNPWLSIVGIVDNVHHFGLETRPSREFFRPYAQAAWPVMTVVTKTAGEPMQWQRVVRDALKRVEADLPGANVRSMEDVVGESVAWRETPMRLLSGFALVGLLLAGIGVYSVLAYYVSQRNREFGIRVALGASRTELVALVLRQSLMPLVIGLALGVAGVFLSGRMLADLLYEVRPGDPLVLSVIASLLIVVSLVSSWLPARRAAAVDPVIVLREE